MIKNLRRRQPRVGHIRLGTPKGPKFPGRNTDYFRLDTDFWPAEDLENAFGNQPKQLSIYFPKMHEDEEEALRLIFDSFYGNYANGRLFCKGNGEIATRYEKEGLSEIPCTCPALEAGECKQQGEMRVALADLPFIGYWSVRTTSWESINSIHGTIELFYKMLGDKFWSTKFKMYKEAKQLGQFKQHLLKIAIHPDDAPSVHEIASSVIINDDTPANSANSDNTVTDSVSDEPNTETIGPLGPSEEMQEVIDSVAADEALAEDPVKDLPSPEPEPLVTEPDLGPEYEEQSNQLDWMEKVREVNHMHGKDAVEYIKNVIEKPFLELLAEKAKLKTVKKAAHERLEQLAKATKPKPVASVPIITSGRDHIEAAPTVRETKSAERKISTQRSLKEMRLKMNINGLIEAHQEMAKKDPDDEQAISWAYIEPEDWIKSKANKSLEELNDKELEVLFNKALTIKKTVEKTGKPDQDVYVPF